MLLSANRDTDGSFALWLDLTLDTSLGKSISTGPEGSQNTLLIGEWKQYRQVNTSTTPTEQPEIRDAKHTQRIGHTQISDAVPADSDPAGFQQPVFDACEKIAASTVDFQSEPMASGQATGAP
jgi:hypothetical protein